MQVDLDGRMYEVRLKIMTIAGFAGHADQLGLVRFALQGQSPTRRVLLVHGEARAKRQLLQSLRSSAAASSVALEVGIPK
ncbi:RNA-metabolising metallo-beta-lactamase [compost metagenome]